MILFFMFFEKYLIYSVKIENGRADYYYYDEITWIVAFLAIAWLAWFLINRVYQARKFIRKTPQTKEQKKILKKIIQVKNKLSKKFLTKGISDNINAIGIGKFNNEFCINVFINDAQQNLFNNSPNETLPNEYEGIPIILIEMPLASFLGLEVQTDQDIKSESVFKTDGKTPLPIRDFQETIIGGISGANTNLNGQSGTIGYFCKRKSIIQRKSDIYILSNKHVFGDLKNDEIDDHDLIVQPSPGESANSIPIGELTSYSDIHLDNDVDNPNSIDAAIAKLWKDQKSENLIPMIGKVKGFAKKEDVEIGEFARKFGRTTGFTAGHIFSISLDIWIKYDRTGQKAFFKDQILIEPNRDFDKFVEKGDSGALVVDGDNFASGLIFAGANGNLETIDSEKIIRVEKTISNYGVANPISDVLEKMKIEFVIDR